MPKFEGDVEVILGPKNHKVQLRRWKTGTPFNAKTIDSLLKHMFKVSQAENAFVSVFAPHLNGNIGVTSKKKNTFTVEELTKHLKNPDVSRELLEKKEIVEDKNGKDIIKYSYYVGLFDRSQDNDFSESNAKVF
jgi:hypothetical protein